MTSPRHNCGMQQQVALLPSLWVTPTRLGSTQTEYGRGMLVLGRKLTAAAASSEWEPESEDCTMSRDQSRKGSSKGGPIVCSFDGSSKISPKLDPKEVLMPVPRKVPREIPR